MAVVTATAATATTAAPAGRRLALLGIHWPGWQHLPRDMRDTLFLLGVIAWTVLPHAGHLPLWCTLLTSAVLVWRAVLALRGAPLPGRGAVVVTLALSIGLTLFSHNTLFGKDPGVTLLATLVALKTLELRARRDAFAVFFLGFFLVLTHFLYSQSLLIAIVTLVSVWGLLTALVLAQMPVGVPSLRQAARLAGRFALLGAPVMAVLFVLFPRVGPLWSVPKTAGATTGLSGQLRMGSMAELAIDDSVAMRVRFLSGTPPPPNTLYFRGPVLGSFDGETWSVVRSRFPADAQPQAELRPHGQPVDYEVTLEPLDLATIPTLDATPRLPPIERVRLQHGTDLQWSADRPINERLRFRATAWPQFEHGPVEPVLGLQDYLHLEPGNPRTLAWAAAVRRDPRYAEADGDALAAMLYQRIRTDGYSYTLSPGLYGEDGKRNGVDEFWLDRKAGFCEHFATAFVVVMRMFDVPARVVTGFQGAQVNPVDGSYVVRQSFAHAWAEYWQPGRGWVRADPTAAVAPDRIDRSRPLVAPRGLVASAIEGLAPDALLRLRAVWDATNSRWNDWVLNYSRGSQRELLQRLGFDAPDWHDLALLLAGLLAGSSSIAAAWMWWQRRRVDPWQRAYARVRQAAAARGVDTSDSTPPRSLAAAVRARHGSAAEAAVAALQALDALRYGRGPSSDAAAPRRAMQLAAKRSAHQAADFASQAVRALRALPTEQTPRQPAANATTLKPR